MRREASLWWRQGSGGGAYGRLAANLRHDAAGLRASADIASVLRLRMNSWRGCVLAYVLVVRWLSSLQARTKREGLSIVVRIWAGVRQTVMEQNRIATSSSPKSPEIVWVSDDPFELALIDKSPRLVEPESPQPRSEVRFRGKRFQAATIIVAVALVAVAGCSGPSVAQQRLVAKSNMTFSGSSAFAYNSSRLLPQLASGFGSSGGAQNSGCTSCR